jgi:hypothetical protein
MVLSAIGRLLETMQEYQWHFFKCLTIQHAAIRYLDFFIVNAPGVILLTGRTECAHVRFIITILN